MGVAVQASNPSTGRLRHWEPELQASLSCVVRYCLNNTNRTKQKPSVPGLLLRRVSFAREGSPLGVWGGDSVLVTQPSVETPYSHAAPDVVLMALLRTGPASHQLPNTVSPVHTQNTPLQLPPSPSLSEFHFISKQLPRACT